MIHHLDLVVKNGKVVFPDGVSQKDIGVKSGKIVMIDDQITLPTTQVEDAQGQYIFPGAIDIHVHFNEPGRTEWEGFTSGSYMLAAGGYTSYFDMPLNGIPSTIDLHAFQQKNEIATEKSIIDYYLWGGLVPGNINNLADLASAGVIGFKAFISDAGNEEFQAADDETLIQGMKEIARLGKVLALHAESKTITDFLTSDRIAKQKLSADDYLASRPIVAEVEAVQKALSYAEVTGCALHFVHISSSEAVAKIMEAKQKGLDVSVETCPHYLLYSHQALQTKGAIAKCAPPLRLEEERQQLIQLLRDNQFDIIASDHSPAPYSLKDPGTHNLFSAWGGISGGQFTLLSMLELAKSNHISLERIADWTALNPAKRFSLEGKGKIATGYDADFTIISFDKDTVVSADNYYAKHKQSLYIGHRFPCSVSKTYNRGNLVFNEAENLNPAN